MKDFSENTVEDVNGQLYLITGEKEIFILNEEHTYSRKLSQQEIEELAIHISWNSKVEGFFCVEKYKGMLS